MGKNWKGHQRGGGRGGGRGGKGGGGGGGNDLPSCRGFAIVVGTCDVARERESSKELVNLLTQAIEDTEDEARELKETEEDLLFAPSHKRKRQEYDASSDSRSDKSSEDSGSGSNIERESSHEVGGDGATCVDTVNDMPNTAVASSPQVLSVKEMLQRELDELRGISSFSSSSRRAHGEAAEDSRPATGPDRYTFPKLNSNGKYGAAGAPQRIAQRIVSINTGIKGVVLAKINFRVSSSSLITATSSRAGCNTASDNGACAANAPNDAGELRSNEDNRNGNVDNDEVGQGEAIIDTKEDDAPSQPEEKGHPFSTNAATSAQTQAGPKLGRGPASVAVKNPFCPVKLVKRIFERVRRERAPCSRHLVRLTPLQRVFFPNEDELRANLQVLSEDIYATPPISSTAIASASASASVLSESSSSSHASAAHIIPSYSLQYKARSHNVLSKKMVHDIAHCATLPHARFYGYNEQRVLLVEALKNIAGVGFVEPFSDLCELNLRKFQDQVVASSATSANTTTTAATATVLTPTSAGVVATTVTSSSAAETLG